MQTVLPPYLFLIIGALILLRRVISMYKPIKGKGIRIFLPLIYLAVGFQFFRRFGHPTPLELCITIVLGLAFSIVIIILTDYEIREDGNIYAVKSWKFVVAFIVMILLRYFMRQDITTVDSGTLSMLLFTFIICYIVPWRIACYIKFRKVLEQKKEFPIQV
ncbi:CcdC protein domain-containing protein [Bacillus cereus]|uniref:CcdC protein domain-containing protein n=1 Tax=Bacillus cereus TaxID=1396 RepID=UPI000B4B2156|nr:CcdC protein domain-containing protein [Bacillus cereus]